MAESELKLDMPCPWCGTPNEPSALRCLQCYQDLTPQPRPGEPALFDLPRPQITCPSCGRTNLLNVTQCLECGAPMTPEAANGSSSLRAAARGRRKGLVSELFGWIKFSWVLRLASVLFLFWGVVDTSTWLTNITAGLPAEDGAALHYSVFAIFELIRDICLVAGVWLLTYLSPRQGA
ncbi:MAG TPA: zinc ribbon domain-containing protein [Oscillatoriaceae cyanobacterium]